MSNKKTKKIGKIIIITLSVAILFFLLLPFLEEDTNSAKNGEAKKAVPQIFTSNPLSELVRKVYAMFARNKRPEQNTQLAFASQENYLSGTLPTDPNAARFDITHEDQSGGSSAVNFSYGGEDIGFINEEGEWVLIQQTNPEMAERGMHEVNTTDKAYDKYVRLERASKYTGSVQNSALEIPDSKWARLWKPIKKLFGKEKGDSVSPKKTDTEQPFALANASAGLGKDREKRTDKYPKAYKPELGGNMDFSLPIVNGQPTPLLEMLNPEIALEESANNLKQTARETLSSEDANAMEKIIDQKTIQMRKQISAGLARSLDEEINQLKDVERESLIGYTLEHCTTDELSPFYEVMTECAPSTDGADNKKQQISLAQAIQQATGDNEISQYFANKQVEMVVVLDVTEPGQNPASGLYLDDNPETSYMPQAKQYAQYLTDPTSQQAEQGDPSANERSYQMVVMNQITDQLFDLQGCQKQKCLWVQTGNLTQSGNEQNINLSQQVDGIVDAAGFTPIHAKGQQEKINQAIQNLEKKYPELIGKNGSTWQKAGSPMAAWFPIPEDQAEQLVGKAQTNLTGAPSRLIWTSGPFVHKDLQNILPEEHWPSIIHDSPSNNPAPKTQTKDTHDYGFVISMDFGTSPIDMGAAPQQASIQTGGPTLGEAESLAQRPENMINRTADQAGQVYAITQKVLQQGNQELGSQMLQRASYSGEHLDDIMGGF